MRPLLLLLVVLAPACSSSRWFAPRENLNGSSLTGFPAAVYPLANGEDVRGDVRIWSDGAMVEEAPGDVDVTVLHVAFEIENTGSAPLGLDLDGLRLDRVQHDGTAVAHLRPTRATGDSLAPPGGRATVQLWFEPGDDVRPRDIDAFEVRWRVRADPVVFDQVTPFVPWVRTDAWDESPLRSGIGLGFGFSAFRWCR